MSAVFFYHLTQRPLEALLPGLISRARAQGWRVEIRGRAEERMSWLDERLWLGADEASFNPHGRAGGAHDAAQPVLLTTKAPENAGTLDMLICIDGAAPTPEEARSRARACLCFDGGDEAAVQTARTHWAALTGAGCAAQYWSEASGSWEMKAEKTAPN